MIGFTSEEYHLRALLRGLLVDAGFRKGCDIAQLEALNLYEKYPYLQVVWDWATAYWQERIEFGPDEFVGEVLHALENGALTEDGQQRLESFRSFAYEHATPPNIAYLQDFLRGKLAASIQDGVQRQMVDGALGLGALADKLKESYDAAVRDPFLTIKPEAPFDDLRSLYVERIPTATGIHFVDCVTDGGLMPAEMAAIIIPSGGGKSMISLQTAHYQVEAQRHVAVISTEQGFGGDFSERLASLSTLQPTRLFRHGYDNIPEDARRHLEAVKHKWQTYFHFFDLNKYGEQIQGISTVTRMLDAEFYDQGREPAIILLDWWGLLRDMLIEAAESSGRRVDSGAERRIVRLALKELRAWCKARGARIIVFHQLGGAAAARSSTKPRSSHDAQEDKNFNNQFDFAFVGSRKDKDTDIVKFAADKARRAANKLIAMKLNGEYARFDPVDADDASAFIASSESYASMAPPPAAEGYDA